MGPPSRESRTENTAAMMPDIVMMIAAGFAIAGPAPSHPVPKSTATNAVAWLCAPAEKIVPSGKNNPTINAPKNENQSHPTERFVGTNPRDVGTPSVTQPTPISTIGKSTIITHEIVAVVPMRSRGITIHAANTKVATQPP